MLAEPSDAFGQLMNELSERDRRIERLQGVLDRKSEERDALLTACQAQHAQMQQLRDLAAAKLNLTLPTPPCAPPSVPPDEAEDNAAQTDELPPGGPAAEEPAAAAAAEPVVVTERLAQALKVPASLREPLRVLDGAAEALLQGARQRISEAQGWGRDAIRRGGHPEDDRMDNPAAQVNAAGGQAPSARCPEN